MTGRPRRLGASSVGDRLDRLSRGDADQPGEIGGGDVALVARLDGSMRARDSCASAEATSFGGTRPAVNRCRTSATCACERVTPCSSTSTVAPRGHDGPEGARHLETKIGLGHATRPRRRPRRRRAPPARAHRCGRRCRSATADRGASGSCWERRGTSTRGRPIALGTMNGSHVIGARVAGECGDRRADRRTSRTVTVACATDSRARASASRWLASRARACASSSVRRSTVTSCAAALTRPARRAAETDAHEGHCDDYAPSVLPLPPAREASPSWAMNTSSREGWT